MPTGGSKLTTLFELALSANLLAGEVSGDPGVDGAPHDYELISARDYTSMFFVYNHLHTVHAIASCNAAEVAMGMLMEATVPRSHRWIPKAMNVAYLAKATTSLRATARLDPPDFGAITEGTEVVVPVSITDKAGLEVVHADITTWVTPA